MEKKYYMSHIENPYKIDSSYYFHLIKEYEKNLIYDFKLELYNKPNKDGKYNILKNILRNTFSYKIIPIPKTWFFPSGKGNKFENIWACHHLLHSKKKWVVDFEHIGILNFSNYKSNFLKNYIFDLFQKENCINIFPWSNACKKSIESYFENKNLEKIQEKIKVLYPLIKSKKIMKKNNKNKLKVVFVSRDFYLKGGIIIFNIIEKILKKTDYFEFIIISNVPKNVKNKFNNLKNLKILPPLKYEKLKKLKEECDIFLYPSLMDTFGLALPEFMSYFTIPFVLDEFVFKEYVNKKNGFILNEIKNKWYDENSKIHNPNFKIIDKKEDFEKISDSFVKIFLEIENYSKIKIENMKKESALSIDKKYEQSKKILNNFFNKND